MITLPLPILNCALTRRPSGTTQKGQEGHEVHLDLRSQMARFVKDMDYSQEEFVQDRFCIRLEIIRFPWLSVRLLAYRIQTDGDPSH